MKKLFYTIFLLLCSVAIVNAQHSTTITITDVNSSLSSSVGATIGNLITELNNAHAQKRTPRLSGFKMDSRTQNSISMLWENSPFRCTESDIVEQGVSFNGEYEVRNIPFVFTDLDKDDRYHEVCISFNKSGMLTGFHMTLGQNLYRKVIGNGNQVRDLKQRQIILDYVEQFRTSYNTKDLNFLNQVFSEDALILVGKVVQTKKTDGMPAQTSVKYDRRTKAQYLKNLENAFRINKRVNVKFDDIKLEAHCCRENVYAVTLHQSWVSDKYSDEGYVVLIWNFSDPSSPRIDVRTWQPDTNPFTGKKIEEKDIFSLDDYEIN